MKWSDLCGDAEKVAPLLLGAVLERQIDGVVVRVKIVEVEAYHQSDAASHSYRGKTSRTETMFGPAGYLYVYFTYGMHYCCNIVVGDINEGAAVLLRAVEPLDNESVMAIRRGKTGVQVSNGPAKVCQALGIDKQMNGHDLRQSPLKLILQPSLPSDQIVTTTRIGITKDAHRLWRFYIANNPYVSKI